MAPVYVLDACVLYPVVLRDLLLTLGALEAFEPRWTTTILDEMIRNVLADHPRIDPAQFEARVVGAMQRAFPGAGVAGFEQLTDQMDNDPKDRHVAAAAVHVGAAALVTYNLRDFDSAQLRRHRISVLTPTAVVAQLAAREPSVVALALREMAARKRRPPMTPSDVVDAIARQQGFAELEDQLRTLVE